MSRRSTETSSSVPKASLIVLLSIFLAGVALATLLQWKVAARDGGWGALITVEEGTSLRPIIEADLGAIPLLPESGHDGKYSYVVARDPFGRRGWLEHMDYPVVRFRRWLYPALSSAFGCLPARATLIGLTTWSAVGMGVAAAASYELGRLFRARFWAPLAVLINYGIFHSVVSSTPDALALGFALAGLCSWLHGKKRLSLLLFIAAAFTKETYVLFAIGVALYEWSSGRRRSALSLAVLPTSIIVGWVLILTFLFQDGRASNEALSTPILGVLQAVPSWPQVTLPLPLLALAGVLAAPLVAWRLQHRLLLALSLPWLALASVSSPLVWRGDSPRAFAPMWVFAMLGAAIYFERVSAGGPTEPIGRDGEGPRLLRTCEVTAATRGSNLVRARSAT